MSRNLRREKPREGETTQIRPFDPCARPPAHVGPDLCWTDRLGLTGWDRSRFSVFRGHFDVVDDQNLDRTFGGFQLEAKLFLDGGKKRGPGVGR